MVEKFSINSPKKVQPRLKKVLSMVEYFSFNDPASLEAETTKSIGSETDNLTDLVERLEGIFA